MRSVNIAELKNRLSLYLNEVKAGGEILVRDRDLPFARIVPLHRDPESDAELLALEAQGKIRIGEGAIEESFWDLPKPRVPADVLKKVLEWERDED